MGNRARMIGLNLIGLKRRGFTRPQIHALRGLFRLLFKEPGVFSDRLATAGSRWPEDAQVAEILAFINAPSKRGLCKAGRDTDPGDEDEEG
jgi:UDP-N-acetylglucosamine acyltransferase